MFQACSKEARANIDGSQIDILPFYKIFYLSKLNLTERPLSQVSAKGVR